MIWLWRKELAFLILFIVIAAIISHFIGHFLHLLVLIFSFIIIRQAILLTQLERWLSRRAIGKIPTGFGIWSDIYYHFYRIKQQDKQRKKKLAKIIEQFRQSTDVLPDAAIVLGNNDEIESTNKLTKLVLGIKKSDKGQRIDNLIRTPEFIKFLKAKNESAILTLPSPVDNNLILQFRMVSYGVKQRLIIAHDVTQQKNMEAMRKNFVDNISHELRTPLTVLKGYIETLQDLDDNPSAIQRHSLDKMQAQTDRMQYLVDDLLLLARLETKKKKTECVDINQLIKKICSETQAIEKNQARIKLNLESSIRIMGEEQDLHSAFTNLIINALKYSAKDKPVTVSWKTVKDQNIFEVTDQGEGISMSEIPRITERFYRIDIKRPTKLSGTGLGLAIVKHVLIRHDAKLEIKSKPGKGSQFKCIFPRSLPDTNI